MLFSILSSFGILAIKVIATIPDGRPHANIAPLIPRFGSVSPSSLLQKPRILQGGEGLPPLDTIYYFDQLIDHNDPSTGTFQQRYWYNYEFYQPGGAVILCTPGESNAEGYEMFLTNQSIQGLIGQQQNGSNIILEHRFYGLSNPKPDLSVESLQLLNVDQAIEDLVYFAENVQLPMPNGSNVGPKQVPWIIVGGSYSGALTSWTMVKHPDVFYAGYASSAVVEAITYFWKYFEPIRSGMPANCSNDVQAVISYIDETFSSNNTSAIQNIQDSFGMGLLDHLDDVVGALRNNLWDWQNLQPSTGANGAFYQFCDALEVKDGVSSSEDGWGIDYALSAWGNYFANTYLDILCGSVSVVDCLGTYNGNLSMWSDESVDNSYRSWQWQVCTELGYFQDGPPEGVPALVSRLVDVSYELRQCVLMFPEAFQANPPTPSVDSINSLYEGWNVTLNRMVFTNAINDPWRDTTVSADGVSVQSTPSQQISVSDAFHCSDFTVQNAIADATVANVQQDVLTAMKTWIATWTPAV